MTNKNNLPITLTVLFVTLKLTDVIAWSWVWVFSPLWIALALGAVLGLVFAVLSKIDQNRISQADVRNFDRKASMLQAQMLNNRK